MRNQLPSLATPLLLLALLGPLACGGGNEPGADAPRTYTVRGQVRQVPQPDRPSSQFLVRHEAIPEFADSGGEVVGMDSMSMPFPVRDEALLEGIEPGDVVELTFRVDWDSDSMLEVEKLVELPADTVLGFTVLDSGEGSRTAPPEN